MIKQPITNKRVKERYNNIYKIKNWFKGEDEDNYIYWYNLLKEKLNIELMCLPFYHSGVYGWNWTGYPTTTDDFVIVKYYRSEPSSAIDITDKLL